MPVDHIRYDILAQDALRGLVRQVLTDAARNGLPGEHHFFISFDTRAEGVKLSPRLREQYPEEMTVVLQHQFWDLKVGEDWFEVGLSFGGVAERLTVPFESITSFVDPSVQFQLQFQTIEASDEDEADEADVPAAPQPASKAKSARGKPRLPARHAPSDAPVPAKADPEPSAGDGGGAEVVRLDRFRKK